jgi:hypothetical protein
MLETLTVSFGGGVYSADLPSAIPDNYCAVCTNAIATGTSVENRFGFQSSNVNFSETATLVNTVPSSFTHLGVSGDEDAPIIMWGSVYNGSSHLHMIREGTPFTDPGGGATTAGYIDAAITGGFVGSVNYNGTYYVFYDTGVHKITAIDWAATSFTSSAISGSPSTIEVPPIHFYDRLWTAQGNSLLYTDAISTPGALPETWDTSNNFIKFVGENGPGKIYKLIPIGTRIYVFTSQGLFSLSIAGSPSDWYIKPLDAKAIVNSYECAFEVGGLIYYVTIYGVFVTNGSDSIKLSGPIENYFLSGNFDATAVAPGKRSNIYRISYLDNGLIVSISNFVVSSGVAYYDTDSSYQFYTRLGNVAWSRWAYSNASGSMQIAAVVGTADSVESYINKTPLNYIMVLNSTSVTGALTGVTRELCVYDGLSDTWQADSGGSANIQVEIRSKFFTGPSPISIKTLSHSYIELFISDTEKYSDSTTWEYNWHTDAVSYESNSVSVDAIEDTDITTNEFHTLALTGGFQYRSCQLEFNFYTSNVDTFKVKSLYMRQDTNVDGPNSIQ